MHSKVNAHSTAAVQPRKEQAKDLQSGETVASAHAHAAAVIMFTEYYNTILPLPVQRGVCTEMTECPIPVCRQYNIYGLISRRKRV